MSPDGAGFDLTVNVAAAPSVTNVAPAWIVTTGFGFESLSSTATTSDLAVTFRYSPVPVTMWSILATSSAVLLSSSGVMSTVCG